MASELKQAVSSAVKDAMRAKEKERLMVLRTVMAEFKKIEVDERIDLDDAGVLSVIQKMIFLKAYGLIGMIMDRRK